MSGATDAGSYRAYGYDARGNATTVGTLTLGYDFANQPTSVTGGTSASYAYDGQLKRVKSLAGGKTVYSVYSALGGSVILRDEVTDGRAIDYLAVGPLGVRLTNGASPEYTHADHLGSPIAASNAAGTISWRESYTPYGEARLRPTGNSNQPGYTGHVQDAATGLTYMQARYYDPVIGRFLATDPIGYRDQLNLYAYVGNDPLNRIDPDGRYGRGTGFSDEEWKKFDKVQDKAASRMERRAEKMERKADKLDSKGKSGGDALRSQAGNLRGGASALRSDGSDGKMANAVDAATYQGMGGSANGAAFINGVGGLTMTVNKDNTAAWNSGGQMSQWVVGHESLHTAGLSDQVGSNGAKAYKFGEAPNKDAYKELRGTDKAQINPDHLMDLVY